MNNLKKVFSIVFGIVILISGMENFVNISSVVTLLTSEVKGYTLVLFSTFFLVYSLFANKKLVYYLSLIFIFIGFVYTFYTLYNVYDETVTLELGLYLYLIGFILFIITALIKDKNKEEQNVQIIEENSLDDNYVMGTYLFGLNKKEFSNKPCAVTNIKDTKDMLIILTSTETLKIEVKYEQINKIVVKKNVSMKSGNQFVEDDTVSKTLLATALIGVWGPVIAQSIDTTGHNKVKYQTSYLVEIYYNELDEEKKVLLETPKNPDSFFKVFDDKYQKNS